MAASFDSSSLRSAAVRSAFIGSFLTMSCASSQNGRETISDCRADGQSRKTEACGPAFSGPQGLWSDARRAQQRREAERGGRWPKKNSGRTLCILNDAPAADEAGAFRIEPWRLDRNIVQTQREECAIYNVRQDIVRRLTDTERTIVEWHGKNVAVCPLDALALRWVCHSCALNRKFSSAACARPHWIEELDGAFI